MERIVENEIRRQKQKHRDRKRAKKMKINKIINK